VGRCENSIVDLRPDVKVLLGRYELGDAIGYGGMAEVRAGRDLTLDRPVAIKLLRSHLDQNDEARARFVSEARSAAQLIHPNIVPVFDSGEEDGTPFIVMELLSGRTLADRIAEGPATEGEARRIGLEILAALAASHEKGILHRDLKPGNVMLTEDGTAKVSDFGIAKSAEGVDFTTTGILLGTPAYLAPERVAGEPASEATDVYSVGVILYELRTGRRPFAANTALGMVRAIQDERPVPLEDLRPDIDPDLIAIVERAMAKNPWKRYATPREMEADLQEWVPIFEADDTQAILDSTNAFRVRRRGGSRFRRRLAGILIALLAIAWPVYVTRSSGRSTGSPEASQPPVTAPPAPPAVAVAPQLDQAVSQLDAILAQTGTTEQLSTFTRDLRAAAQAGDRLEASEQLRMLRERTRSMVDAGDLTEPNAGAIEAGAFQVDLHIGTIYPPPPAAPPPGG
jgi:serine/threonine protein kinase